MIRPFPVDSCAEGECCESDPIEGRQLRSVLATAYARLDDLYVKSMENGDIKTAFQVQKEIHRLLQFGERVTSDEDREGAERSGHDLAKADAALSRIREHLLPLGLADESYPIQEHARLAAALISNRCEEVGDPP